ncbi:MAG: DUF6062 family protein [Elusimicrobiota bacterium]
MKEKHMPYYELLNACGKNECPVCFLVKHGIKRYFDSLLYESVNDVGLRQEFVSDKGFCNFHSYKLLGYHDDLAFSIMHLDLLRNEIKELKVSRLKPKETKNCIVCKLSRASEIRYIGLIKDYLNDEEFKIRFLESKGLCVPHYEMLKSEVKKLPKWFNSFQIKKYEELYEYLDRFNDSFNASHGRKRLALTDDEKESCNRTARTLFGYEGRIQVK